MESDTKARVLVGQLLQARLERQPIPLPSAFGLTEAYEIQRLHQAQVLSRFGGCVAGMKLGATNPQSLTALGYAGSWVRGEPCAQWRDLDLVSLPDRLSVDEAEVRRGSGAMVLGDPLHALALAIADMGREGRAIKAGDVVSTGTCTVPLVVSGTASVVADFGPLGQIALELS